LLYSSPKFGLDKRKRSLSLPQEKKDLDVGQGCKFFPRCSFAKEICKKSAPSLSESRPGHFVSCHLST